MACTRLTASASTPSTRCCTRLTGCFAHRSQRGWARKRALRDWCAQRGLSADPLDDALADRGFGSYATQLSGPALWRVARAVVAGALYPRLVKIEKPSQKYAETSEGNIAMDAQARELRFLRRTPTGALERAFLHPTSSCYAERSW